MRWTSSLRWSNGGTYDTAECCHLHFEDQAGCPRREDSLGHVLLHVQTAVLRALVWNGGPGYCCQEPSCCCDGLSSFGPLTGPVFISLCDLKWPCTVRWNVAPDSVLLPWEHGPKAGVGFSPHAGIPIPQGRRSLKRLGALPQEPCHHPTPHCYSASPAGRLLLLPPRKWAEPWSPKGLGTEKGIGVLSSLGGSILECVLVPGSGRLCPMDISAGCGSQPIRNRTWPQGSLN